MCGVVTMSRGGPAALEAAMDRMKYRGTRSRVETVCGGYMGHVRLPINGLSTDNDQPLRRRHYTIGFVGEVLDFRDHSDHDCDAQFAADQFERLGPGCLNGHDGFWHLVAFNNRTREITAFTDYLAQKPVYYRSDEQAIAAASEPDALAAMGRVTFDETYMAAVQKWGYCPETWRTPYNEIRRIQPGGCVILGNRPGAVCQSVVDPITAGRFQYDARDTPADALARILRQRLERAVELRVTASDVPVSALVSGGLDSSITYTLARQHSDVQVYHADNDERWALDALLQRSDASAAVQVPCDPGTVDLDHALGYMQEPVDLGSLRAQTALSDAIRWCKGEHVCLTGDGADELFGGYGRALRYDSQFSDVWHELVGWHLPRLDRVMMRNRIEVRSPFLAREVVEMALALPWELRSGKRILKEAFSDVLPPEIINQEKRALRAANVKQDREAHSIDLVRRFKDSKTEEVQ